MRVSSFRSALKLDNPVLSKKLIRRETAAMITL